MKTLHRSVFCHDTSTLDNFFLVPECFKQISIVAHRGAHSKYVPENSLRAALEAYDRGLGIEIDVRASRDGTLMCFHDTDLWRMCGIKERISHMSYNSLKELSLLRSSSRIPPLEGMLEKMPEAPMLIHIKSIRTAQVFGEFVRKNPNVGRHTIVQAFPTVMSYLKNINGVRLVELHSLSSCLAYMSKGHWFHSRNRRALSVSNNFLRIRGLRWLFRNWPIIFSWTCQNEYEVETAQGLNVLPISDWLPVSSF